MILSQKGEQIDLPVGSLSWCSIAAQKIQKNRKPD
jgi:hypothetical protein